ncbi:heterogeneous nuclear ribonucleoprotein A1-like isoform X1 [Cydia splendana]|uniref:heterogeneous nuclear ribonucleoprotein A1-like isoform X1 n=1 Tax=Cydia splendana TaxID=1100963 RepID=UPI002128D728
MVAQKRGRGAKAQAAKKQAAQAVEEVPEEVAEAVEPEENNGDSEQVEQGDEGGAGDAPSEEASQAEGEAAEAGGEAPAEEPKEEKVESGKLLVENLPASYLFDYQDKLKELFSKHGEINAIKRGPIIVTEQTITPTLSAIVEFKNKDSLDKALSEQGRVIDGSRISVAVESRAETAVLVGVPYEAGTEYVRRLFNQCGEVAHIHEFSKTKYKILRVTFHNKESVEKALKLDRELRVNGFLVTVSKYRDEDEQKAHSANANKNKRQHPQQQQNRNANANSNVSPNANPNANRQNNYRPRGGAFNARGNFRGGRGRGGFPTRGFPARGGFGAPVNSYAMPGFMGGFMNDGQRPNKRPRL